jgi:hypothetical protein
MVSPNGFVPPKHAWRCSAKLSLVSAPRTLPASIIDFAGILIVRFHKTGRATRPRSQCQATPRAGGFVPPKRACPESVALFRQDNAMGLPAGCRPICQPHRDPIIGLFLINVKARFAGGGALDIVGQQEWVLVANNAIEFRSRTARSKFTLASSFCSPRCDACSSSCCSMPPWPRSRAIRI